MKRPRHLQAHQAMLDIVEKIDEHLIHGPKDRLDQLTTRERALLKQLNSIWSDQVQKVVFLLELDELEQEENKKCQTT